MTGDENARATNPGAEGQERCGIKRTTAGRRGSGWQPKPGGRC
jgi:hypothetical protein